MEPENLNEEPIVNPPQQNQRSWWYYPLSWVVQLVVFTITLAIFGAGLALVTLALVDFLGFTQQYNLFVALIVYGLVIAGSVWLGLKLDKKYHFYYFISANLLAAVAAILLLTFASVFSLYGNDRESYGEQSSLRNAQMNLRAAAELHYNQNNLSYSGFCESEFVQEVRTKADLLTAQSKVHNHLLTCAATKESYAVEIPYFEPMQDAYLCVSANAEPVATSTSVISNAGLCGTEAIEAEGVGESTMIDTRTFSWNGQTGTVLHECIRESAEKDLLYFGPPPFNESRDIAYCNQKSVLSVEFGEESVILEEFSVATTSDYKKIKGLGFTTDQFTSRRNSEFLVGATTSQNMPEKLLLSFYHDEKCEWNDRVCPGGQSITHYVSLPDLTIYTEPQIGAPAGRGAVKWNAQRTAFVMRTYGDDIQPSFFLCVLGQSDCERYDDVTLSYNANEWTQEQSNFADRMWSDNDVEWLSENEVRIFDDVISLEEVRNINGDFTFTNYELEDDVSSLLSFVMPSEYSVTQDLSDSLWFEAGDYYKEGTLLSPSLKKCVESSNGMSVSISMNDRSFDPRLLPSEEFVENRSTFAEENGWLTSIETIDGQLFSRAEKIDANCEHSYTISYSGQVEGYITNFQFWFEGDYKQNVDLIEKILDSMDFKLE